MRLTRYVICLNNASVIGMNIVINTYQAPVSRNGAVAIMDIYYHTITLMRIIIVTHEDDITIAN